MAIDQDIEGEDPFACFDSDDDDDDESDSGQAETISTSLEDKEAIPRDPGNGVLAFHAGTEIALVHYVKTELAKKTGQHAGGGKGSVPTTQETIDRAQMVLELVDSYCLSRHWMMHVGPEKQKPLGQFIGDCLMEAEKTLKDATNNQRKVLTVVELGTYCGYSSIFIAKTMLEHCLKDGDDSSNGGGATTTDNGISFKIYSVEVVEKFATLAQELIQLAGMEAYVRILLRKDPDATASSLASDLKQVFPPEANPTKIDFLFVDHDKSMYLPHLRELEDAGMIRAGTYVAADNVVFAQIDDYRQYMAHRADEGIVSTRLEDDSIFVEYCQPELAQAESSTTTLESASGEDNTNQATAEMMRDGIEFSVYLRDPP